MLAPHPKKKPYREGEEFILNMGPQHPSTHGVLNFLIRADGEVMKSAIPEIGYLHRGMEKIAEGLSYPGFMPYTDRIDYLASMFCNQGYAMAVEQLLGVEVPRRAEYLRVIACELNRIANHLVMTGCVAMDLGAYTPFIHWLRERETINDMMDILCGARLTYNYMRIGGVCADLRPGLDRKIIEFLDHFDIIVPEFNRLISGNEIFVARLANIAVITAQEAGDYGLVGPNLRASGVDWDLRRDRPYSVYPEFKFDVPVGKGWQGTVGDCYDRFYIRIEEMVQSSKIVRQAVLGLPEGDYSAKVPRRIKPPSGEVFSRVESARGEIGYYLISNGTETPYRLKIRTGSFTAMSIVEKKSRGLMIADLVAFISSLDVVAPEIDR